MAGPAPSATRAESAYETVKAWILSLEMAPGSGFTELQLAQSLGISKTPVREALTKLERERLVVVIARSRYQVAPIMLKDTRDLFAIRTLLEGEAAFLAAARLTDTSQLQDVEALCRETYAPDDPGSIVTFLEHNTRFHLTVASASGNDRLTDALCGVLDQMERLFRIGLAAVPRPQAMVHEHTDLVKAMVRGDGEAARAAAVAQCRASQEMVVDALLASGALDSVNVWTSSLSVVGSKAGA